MNLASDLVHQLGAHRAHGALLVADEQTAGIGRRGRAWDSDAYHSLLFSLVWAPWATAAAAAGTSARPPPLDAAALLPQMVHLNLAAPVAVASACASIGVSSAKIKWPNDVWAGEPPRKLSGVLLNMEGDAAVLGVGVNVHQDMSERPYGTSVATLLRQPEHRVPGVEPPQREVREALLAAFCLELERLMDLSTEAVIDEHSKRDLLRGRKLRVHHRSREESDPRDYDAHALRIDPSGQLVVARAGGGTVSLSGEEISITPYL